jgi:hypothetical protein
MTAPHRYRYAGIEIASWLPLPGLDPSDGCPPEVHILRAAVPRPAGGQTPFGYFAQIPHGIVLEIPDCARFAITGGDTIAMELLGNPAPDFLRLYLLGSALGALLHQRGVLPLHAGSICIEDRAFALVGESGAGKSTLTALLAAAGASYLADDVCPVGMAGTAQPVVWPGIRRVRLSPEACNLLVPSGGAGDADPFGKHILEPPWHRPDRPVPLRGLLILHTDDALQAPRLAPAPAREVLAALVAHTYRPTFLTPQRRGSHLAACAALAARLPGWHLVRPWGLEQARQDAAELLRALSAQTDERSCAAR